MSSKKVGTLVVGTTLFIAVVLLADHFLKFAGAPLPCKEPIAYVIGTFDRKFGISQEYFLDALSEAKAIWEDPINKELFVYAPESGEMTVNLIYDYRQEVTSTLSGLESLVAEDEATYNILRARYINLKTEYNGAKSIYDARVKMFNEKSVAYQSQVESWNKGKRTSRTQFDQLEKERMAFEQEIAELAILERQLNEMLREINSLVGILNRLAGALNLNVEAYNTIGASRGETFTGGVYYSSEDDWGIDVYEFNSREKLVRVLAHELGHALGLDHVADSAAIMYYLNEGDTEVLAQTDLGALRALCGIE
ncbi:MAG: matrixin family metalloprotease [Parcubacteria group bacterium]